MVRTFIQTREFSRNWDKLGFKDEDLRKLELELLEYSKNEKENLSQAERNGIKSLIEQLKLKL